MGWASAAAMAEAGICRVLTSDYFYPCLLRAPFVLAGAGRARLAEAWALVAANAGGGGGLARSRPVRGGAARRCGAGRRCAGAPRLVATIAAGRMAWLSAEGAERLG